SRNGRTVRTNDHCARANTETGFTGRSRQLALRGCRNPRGSFGILSDVQLFGRLGPQELLRKPELQPGDLVSYLSLRSAIEPELDHFRWWLSAQRIGPCGGAARRSKGSCGGLPGSG